MPKFEVKQIGFSKYRASLERRLKSLKNIDTPNWKYHKEAQEEIATMYVMNIKAYLHEHGRSGLLEDSIKADFNGKTLSVYSDKSMFNGTDEHGKKITYYAPFVENGTTGPIKPKNKPFLQFYSPWYNTKTGKKQNWWRLPWVNGQEGQHFMERASKSQKLADESINILEKYVVKAIYEDWVGKNGKRTGNRLTRAGRRDWEYIHGGQAFPTRWNKGK